MTIHRFQISVDCTDPTHDAEGVYFDNGMIALPDSYCEEGEPTRLVISCHGAGGTVTTDDSQIEQQALTKYLLSNGYAVMDVNGLPDEYASKRGIDIRNNIGSPIAIQSYVKAYRYCIERFHLKKEVFVHGASMGGISSTNLVLSQEIPVIAQSGFCPVLDTYHQIFLHPWSNGAPKIAMEKFYGFSRDEKGEAIYDESKLAGYNPMGRVVGEGENERLSYPVPVAFWQCEDDPVVNIASTKRLVKAIQNAGGVVRLRTFARGGHEPQLCGNAVQAPCGNSVFQNTPLKILPAVDGVLLWIREFD